MFSKIDRYILIAILILVGVCVYFLFQNKKDTNAQSDLLVAMARNLNATSKKHNPSKGVLEEKEEEKQEEIQLTEAQESNILKIADKLCFDLNLNESENKFYKEFKTNIDSEVVTSKTMLNNVISKFLSGASLQDFHELEKEFYEANEENINNIIHEQKIFSSIIHKITSGITENFTDEELEYRENNNKAIEKELARLKKIEESGKEFKGANPPLASGERLKLILSLFDDKKVKTVTELAELYAQKTNTKIHKGNVGTILGNYVDEGKLKCIKGDSGKIYHGLPQWFSDKKLIADFCPKEWLNKEGQIKYDYKTKISK